MLTPYVRFVLGGAFSLNFLKKEKRREEKPNGQVDTLMKNAESIYEEYVP